MKLGTKSLLFGVHQFAWHPWTVARAWRAIYGRWPDWRVAICILVHDWGYWGCAEMDGKEGEQHPRRGAAIASWLFDAPEDTKWLNFMLGHSRTMARLQGIEQSKLCGPDKLSIAFDPPAFYLFRARLTGELAEYRANAERAGFMPACAPDRSWHRKLVEVEKYAWRPQCSQS